MLLKVEQPRIFLCYAHEDLPQVQELHRRLCDAGYKPWLDKVDLTGGEKWAIVIHREIERSHIVLACLSKHSLNKRGFVQREINIALSTLQELLDDDIKLIPVRLQPLAVDEVPEKLQLFQWVDYFAEDGWPRLLRAIRTALDRLGVIKPVRLRSHPATLPDDEVTAMLRRHGFYDQERHPEGDGITHQYELIERDGAQLVIDHTTGLTWQQGGSEEPMDFKAAQAHIKKLNAEKFAGRTDWRLPTLEEAMSLMQPRVSSDGLFTDPVFDKTQRWIWTADTMPAGLVWVVSFSGGYCGIYGVNNDLYIRAVF